MKLEVLQADVTRLEVDAIANAANTELAHGGGVAAAISRAGGPEVQRESDARAPIAREERSPIAREERSPIADRASTAPMTFRASTAPKLSLGEAVETTAGAMPARWVIHAATMELGGPTSAAIIAAATRSTLARADELGCRSLALVAFGTGVGGFPLEQAAQLMVDAVREHEPRTLDRIVFAVHGAAAERAFAGAVG